MTPTPYEHYLERKIDGLERQLQENEEAIRQLQGIIDESMTSPPQDSGEKWFIHHMFSPHEVSDLRGQIDVYKEQGHLGTVVRLSARSKRDLELLCRRMGYVFDSMCRKIRDDV